MIRVIVVEDQAMLRESLSGMIGNQCDMTVMVKLSDAQDVPEAVFRLQPDLVLMDVCTENGSNGIVAARKIKEIAPEIKVVIMTGMPEMTFVQQARDANVDSFVYKNVGTRELLNVMRSTMEGYSTFPNNVSGVLLVDAQLTEAEIDILRLVCETKTRKEIAAELYLSEGTVKRRISEILLKTGHDSILKLAVYAVSNGYIVPWINGKE